MIVYLDVVFIENAIMNFIILYATVIVLKNKISYIRIIIASSIGSIYTIISYVMNIENTIFKIILSIIMIYITINPQNVQKMWKSLLVFYITTFTLGGISYSLIYFIEPEKIMIKNGMFIGTYPIKIIMLSGIIGFIIIVLGFKLIKNKISKKDLKCQVIIKYNKKMVKTEGLIDTGNLLKEPISRMPVIVVEKNILYEILPKEILDNIDKIIGGDWENINNQFISKLKLIPYSSLGKENGMMLGIKAEEIEIKNEEINYKTNNIIIGIYNKSLTKKGRYKALIGIDTIEGG